MPKTFKERCVDGARLAGRNSILRAPHRCTLHGRSFEVRLVHEAGCPEKPCDCLPAEELVCAECDRPTAEVVS